MPYRYFAAVLLCSLPFWLAGAFLGGLPLPVDLPVSALMAFVPGIVALVFVWRTDGRHAAWAFARRIADGARVQRVRWYVAAFSFMPAVMVLSYVFMRVLDMALPEPDFQIVALPILFAMFLIAGLGEELGWQGYAYEKFGAGWSAFGGALVLGLFWTFWHIIPYFQTGHDGSWVIWHCGVTVLLRVATVWVYVNGGRSVFCAALFHAMSNVSFFLFPNGGSHYAPEVTFWVLAAASAGLLFLWGPGTLARFRYR